MWNLLLSISLVVLFGARLNAQSDLSVSENPAQEQAPDKSAQVIGTIKNWSPQTEKLDIKFGVEKYQLANGLTVLLHQDNSVPMVSYHTWFRVGSRNEEIGKTGLAHFLEHLMFKGTERFPNKEFDKILRSNGITNNAFTSRDYTGYYEILPSDKLELMIEIEADRLQNLQIRESDFTPEREVVKEERRSRVDNSPSGTLWESVFKTVFRVHPYGWPVIGWMRDLNSMQIEWLESFYNKYYGPNNAVLILAGDFDIDHAKRLIERYYAKIPKIQLPKLDIPREPQQKGQRNANIKKNVKSEMVSVVFKVPEAGSTESYVLDLASNILGNGTSSRLYKRLVVKEKLASSVSAYNYSMKDHGVFLVQAQVLPGKSREKIKKSIYGELWKLRNVKVTPAELNKAKIQVMTNYVDALTTIDSRARLLAVNEILFDDYSVAFRDLDKYQLVTKEQILQSGERFLNPHQRSVIELTKK